MAWLDWGGNDMKLKQEVVERGNNTFVSVDKITSVQNPSWQDSFFLVSRFSIVEQNGWLVVVKTFKGI